MRLPFRSMLICLLALSAPVRAAVTTPAPGPLRIIGSQNAGCIAGAVPLPADGPGFLQIRASHSSFWGAPATIAAIAQLGARGQAAGLPPIYVGDISDPRGGPLRGGHFSHQMGIDADIWLDVTPHAMPPPEARDGIEVASLVRPDGHDVDPATWRPEVASLIRLAAGLPNIDRILVNPAIKQRLCRDAKSGALGDDIAWLHLIRPWWGHASHMHIRWRCPTDQPACVQAPPPPAGDGCDASLDWWFTQLDHPAPPTPPAAPPPLPVACRAILAP